MARETFLPVPSVELAETLAQDSDVRLLDVRTPAEFGAAHIAGAFNLPLDVLLDHARTVARQGLPLVLICQSGQRAARAAEVLHAAGNGKVRLLEGGLNAWSGAGLPVERGRARMSLERQVRIVAGAIAGLGGLLALVLHPLFALLPAVLGGGLVFAGLTDSCGMAMALAKLPYNRPARIDARSAILALTEGKPVRERTGGACAAVGRSCG